MKDTAERTFGQVKVEVTVEPVIGKPSEWADARLIAEHAIEFAVQLFRESGEGDAA